MFHEISLKFYVLKHFSFDWIELFFLIIVFILFRLFIVNEFSRHCLAFVENWHILINATMLRDFESSRIFMSKSAIKSNIDNDSFE